MKSKFQYILAAIIVLTAAGVYFFFEFGETIGRALAK